MSGYHDTSSAPVVPIRSATAGASRREIACIGSAPWNPYLRLLYAHLRLFGYELAPDAQLTLRWLWRARGRAGVVHLHWIEVLHRFEGGPTMLRPVLSWARLVALGIRLVWARLLGYRVVWTVHQVYPHESTAARRERVAALLVSRLADVLVAHEATTATFAERELGLTTGRVEVVPHGSYVDAYPTGRSRQVVRGELGLPDDAFVFLAFGELRPYKGIELLLEAFAAASLPAAALVIAGNAKSPALAGRVRDASATDTRIRPLLGFVADDRVQELFAACDAAVLARSDGGTSGALILALSMGSPTVAAATPGYVQLLGDGRAGWLFAPGDPASLAAALETAATSSEEAKARGAEARKAADRLDWSVTAERMATLL